MYRETTGAKSVDLLHRIERSEHTTITCSQTGEERRTVCDPSGQTLEWQIKKADMDIVARMEDGKITIKGRRQGKPIAEILPQKELPWFQLLSFSLGPFVTSEKSSLTFQMLRPDTLTMVTLEAKKQGVENVLVEGKEVSAIKVRVSPPWPLCTLWKGYYWFRESDPLFLRYEGTNGPPGTKKTVVQFLSKLS
jgi:hypothetical protein